MDSVKHDLQKDVGSTHAPPEGGSFGFQMLSASPMDGTGSAQSRRPPALTLEASRDRQGSWNTTPDRDQAVQAEPDGEVAGYRARMLAKVSGDQGRAIAFTDAELADFLSHAKGLGFGQADIEAILAVKVRKPGVKCHGLKRVADCLFQKLSNKNILFKEGWDFMRAYREAQETMLQGGVLAPATYLDEDYMDMHKKAFSEMASYLVTGENYELYVLDKDEKTPNLGYKGALYISTVAEIDRILEEAQGNIATLELNLGIPAGWWQGKQGIWRIDVHEPENKLLRIPDGSEATANEFWTPGGMTSGGALEAVVGEVPKVKGVTYSAKQVIFEESVENSKLIL